MAVSHTSIPVFQQTRLLQASRSQASYTQNPELAFPTPASSLSPRSTSVAILCASLAPLPPRSISSLGGDLGKIASLRTVSQRQPFYSKHYIHLGNSSYVPFETCFSTAFLPILHPLYDTVMNRRDVTIGAAVYCLQHRSDSFPSPPM